MLYFLVKRDHAHFVARFRNRMDDAAARSVVITTYEDLLQNESLQTGTYVFTSIGVLGSAQRVLATTVWDHLASAGCRLLNHPSQSLNRYDLLTEMHGRGINSFRAFRVTDLTSISPTYPVFVREARHHTGSLTDLVYSKHELERCVDDVIRRGFFVGDLIVVEFCETKDPDGIYRKYSAFRVGDDIIPRYLDFSLDWVVKRSDEKLGDLFSDARGKERSEEQFRYVSDNPHESWLRETFNAARIEYGRMDYGILREKPQIWEINTAPSFGTGLAHLDPARIDLVMLRRPAARVFYARFLSALARLSAESVAAHPIPINIESSIRRAVGAEFRAEANSARVRSIVALGASRFRSPMFDRLKRLLRPVITRAIRRIR